MLGNHCSSLWHPTPEGLHGMMSLQDRLVPWGPRQGERFLRQAEAEGPNDTCGLGFEGSFYNEVVMDKWEHPWEPELAELIEAVFIPHGASPSVLQMAREEHADIVDRIARDNPGRVPLLWYNDSADVPFWPIHH